MEKGLKVTVAGKEYPCRQMDEFADNLSPADLQAWAEALADEGDGEGEAPDSEKKA